MRRNRFRAQPQVEGLESMTLLSAAAGTLAAATEPMIPVQIVAISGTAKGTFTGQQSNPDTGATDKVLADGKLSGVGQTLVTGSLVFPGNVKNGTAKGSLTLQTLRGSLTLKLVQVTPTAAVATTSSTHTFDFTITKGTGKFRGKVGTGLVSVTLTSKASASLGSHTARVGTITLKFSPTVPPVA